MDLSRRTFIAASGAALAQLSLPACVRAATSGPSAPFPELTVAGEPLRIGRAHGEEFKEKVKNNVGFYLDWLGGATGRGRDALLGVAGDLGAVIGKHAPDLLDEMRGIAAASGHRLEEVVAVNARTDLLVVGRRKASAGAGRGGTPDPAPGCTAMALLQGDGEQPRVVLGQNWDWRAELQEGVVVLRAAQAGKPRVVTFTEAGMVGKIGHNEHGLGVCLNFLSHRDDRPDGPLGVPVHVLLRQVMQCETLEQAVALVRAAPRCASANFLMAQQRAVEPRALDLEWTSRAAHALRPREGRVLVHTNHFVHGKLSGGCEGQGGRSTTNRYRTATATEALLREKVPDPATRMMRTFATRRGAPYAVSKTAARDSPSATLASVVMDLSRDALHLCKGPPHAGTWVRRPGTGGRRT